MVEHVGNIGGKLLEIWLENVGKTVERVGKMMERLAEKSIFPNRNPLGEWWIMVDHGETKWKIIGIELLLETH